MAPDEKLSCPNCGADIYYGDAQCLACGAALDEGQLADEIALQPAVPEIEINAAQPEYETSPEHPQPWDPAAMAVGGGLLRASLRLVGCLILYTGIGAIIGVLLLTVLDVYLYIEHYILFGVPVEILLEYEYEDAARVALAGAIGGFAAAFARQIRFAVGEALGCRTLGLNTVIGAAA